MIVAAAGCGVLLAATAAVWAFARDAATPIATLKVVKEYPHDAVAFTQGLVIRDGILNESTGLYGRSTVRQVDLATGKVENYVKFDDRTFGEGMTILGDEIFVVTWQNKTGYVLDRKTLASKRSFRYAGEGWGLTDDGKQLILSDGTAMLRFLDPQDGRVLKRLPVRDGDRLVEKLNELEYIDGMIYANIWFSRRIARIDAATGKVLGWIDATPLWQHVDLGNPQEDVLNGIAYDRDSKKLYVTGKRWPKLFEVEVVE
jgi:glutamine cyclotransferase